MHRKAMEAKQILERLVKRRARAARKEADGAVWVERFTARDLREVQRAITLLEETDLRTRVDPSRRKKTTVNRSTTPRHVGM